MANSIVNGFMFNVSWFAIVATHSDAIAPVIVLMYLGLHFFLYRGGWREVGLVIGVSAAGFIFDALLFTGGIMTQTSGESSAPLWLTCLWPVFATTLTHLFAFLMQRHLLAAALGAIGGATSYLAGSRLADVTFASVPEGPLLMATAWAILFPSLMVLSRHVCGSASEPNG